MPGMAEEIDGAMQQAPQLTRQFISGYPQYDCITTQPSLTTAKNICGKANVFLVQIGDAG
jgi:hypothetical protein